MAKKSTSKTRKAPAVDRAAAGSEFPARIILGQGYPWAMGAGPSYCHVALGEQQTGFSPLPLNWPKMLWQKNVPQYRLVLELVDTQNAKTVPTEGGEK